MLKYLNTKNKNKLFVQVKIASNIASKEIFCYGRNFFLLEVRLIGFCYARKKVLRL